MFHEEYTALCNAGVAKNNLLKKIHWDILFHPW